MSDLCPAPPFKGVCSVSPFLQNHVQGEPPKGRRTSKAIVSNKKWKKQNWENSPLFILLSWIMAWIGILKMAVSSDFHVVAIWVQIARRRWTGELLGVYSWFWIMFWLKADWCWIALLLTTALSTNSHFGFFEILSCELSGPNLILLRVSLD